MHGFLYKHSNFDSKEILQIQIFRTLRAKFPLKAQGSFIF